MNEMLQRLAVDRGRILVIDDIADNLFLMQTILEGEGYSVESADSGRAALSAIAQSPPDLVLLDVMMPEMNGFEVARIIRQNPSLPYIPILLITGYTPPAASDTVDLEVDGFISKPIDFDILLSQVDTALQKKLTFLS